MKKFKKRKEEKRFTINLVIFIGLSIFFLSIGYSILRQDLTIEGIAIAEYKGPRFAYDVSCTSNKWNQNDDHYYQCEPGTLTFKGNETIYNWEVVIDVPDDAVLVSCYGNTTCNIKDGLLYIYNTNLNGTMAPNTSTRIGFLFYSKSDYELIVEQAKFYNFEHVSPYEENIAPCIQTSLQLSNLGWANQLVLNINNTTTYTAYYWEVVIPIPANTTFSNIYGADYIIKDDSIIFYGLVNQNNGQLEPNNSKSATMFITSQINGYHFNISSITAKVINFSDTKACGANV